LQQSRETFSQAIQIILVFLMGTRIDAALHLAARRSRQNVNLFLREPLAAGYFAFQTATRQPTMDRAGKQSNFSPGNPHRPARFRLG